MVVSEKCTVLRNLTCYERDQKNNKTSKVKGWFVDYLVYNVDSNGVVTTYVKNTYIRADSGFDGFKLELFKAYVFDFDFSGTRLFFRGFVPASDVSTIKIEV